VRDTALYFILFDFKDEHRYFLLSPQKNQIPGCNFNVFDKRVRVMNENYRSEITVKPTEPRALIYFQLIFCQYLFQASKGHRI
jgi:hypothetical protein